MEQGLLLAERVGGEAPVVGSLVTVIGRTSVVAQTLQRIDEISDTTSGFQSVVDKGTGDGDAVGSIEDDNPFQF